MNGRLIRRSFMAMALAISPQSLQAQSNNPAWLETLSEQLALEQGCEVTYYIFLKKNELAGRMFYEARAQCLDGRQFDGARDGETMPFKISLCEQVAVC